MSPQPPLQTPTRDFKRRQFKWRSWALAGLGLLGVCLLFGGWLLLNVLPYAILRPHRVSRWAFCGACEPATYHLNADNLIVLAEPSLWLYGWFVRAPRPARGTIVLLHGSGSSKEALLSLAKLFAARDYNCLLYDSRAHGESGGKYCTFGYYERRDCSRFIDEAERRFGPLGPIGIFGNSLGGAVALQTMADDPRICCGVVESPFATLREIVRDYMHHYSGISSAFVSDLALERAAALAHFSVDAVKPEEAASRIHQPVLVLHGMQDRWIDFRQGERVFHHLTAPGSRFVPVAGADHDNLWQKGGADYQRAILDFLEIQMR